MYDNKFLNSLVCYPWRTTGQNCWGMEQYWWGKKTDSIDSDSGLREIFPILLWLKNSSRRQLLAFSLLFFAYFAQICVCHKTAVNPGCPSDLAATCSSMFPREYTRQQWVKGDFTVGKHKPVFVSESKITKWYWTISVFSFFWNLAKSSWKHVENYPDLRDNVSTIHKIWQIHWHKATKRHLMRTATRIHVYARF